MPQNYVQTHAQNHGRIRPPKNKDQTNFPGHYLEPQQGYQPRFLFLHLSFYINIGGVGFNPVHKLSTNEFLKIENKQ